MTFKLHVTCSIFEADLESRTQCLRPRTEKKIRGQNQGPAFQVQTLSRPRAELVEAKAKDQEENLKKSYGRQTLTVFKRKSVRHYSFS